MPQLMMEPKKSQLSSLEIDALKETANIGAGNSTMALSKLFNRAVNLSIPDFQVISAKDLQEFSNKSKDISNEGGIDIGIYSRVQQGLGGNIVITLPFSSVQNTINGLSNSNEQIKNLDESYNVILKKFGSIICGSYLTGISKFFQQKIVYLAPKIITLHGDSILDFILLNTKSQDEVVLIKIGFSIDEYMIEGKLILLLFVRTISPLLEKIQNYAGM